MASKERKNGGDFVLESRHLVGLFFLLVVIFGVVFTLGYLLGRSQYDANLRAAVVPASGAEAQATSSTPKGKAKPEAETAQLPKKNSDWDFYHSAEPQASADRLQPASKSVAVTALAAAQPKSAVASKPVKGSNAPSGGDDTLIPKGAIMLQVAAVLHQDDALALAQALQQKKFPAFVLTPGADKLYRVQVGPYSDNQSAANARQRLEAQGFKSIIKR